MFFLYEDIIRKIVRFGICRPCLGRIPVMHLLNQSPRERRGISLVELLVVVAIISIIMSMILVVLVKTYHAVEAFRH